MLSTRAITLDKEANFYLKEVKDYKTHHQNEDIIDLMSTQMKLMEDIIQSKMQKVTQNLIEPSKLYYPKDFSGSVRFKETMAAFLMEYFSAKRVNPENICTIPGVGMAIEDLAFSLADPEDTFLAIGPYRLKFCMNLRDIYRVNVVAVPTIQRSGNEGAGIFELSVSAIEKTYEKARSKGANISGMIVVNPTNPTGQVLSIALLYDILHFCHRKNLHVIFDEIYALSVFDENVKFHSILSLENIPDPQRTHFLWGPSKDFGMPGMQLGVLHTENEMLMRNMKRTAYYFGTTEIGREILCRMVEDQDWMRGSYLPEYRRRLEQAYAFTKQRLQSLDIPVLPAQAALFAFADFSKFLSERTAEAELELYQYLRAQGILIDPSSNNYLGGEPGWFRLNISVYSKNLVEGLDRLEKILIERAKEQDVKKLQGLLDITQR